MGLEVANFISELIITNPVGPNDFVDKGDDHLRLLKDVLQKTLPNANAAINPTPTEFNLLVGLTGTVWASSNDGAASGLDADLLDAQHGAYYLDLANGTGSMTDSLHGTRAGGTLHADATTSLDGFMAAADKTKLDGIEVAATADQTKIDIDGLGISAASLSDTASGALIDVQIFISTGTWTKPGGTQSAEAWATGGGAGGGGADGTTGSAVSCGGGGGGGGCAYKHITSGLGTNEAVTVGTGGGGGSTSGGNGGTGNSSSFGSHVTGNGGGAGPGLLSTKATASVGGGDGGSGTAADGFVHSGHSGTGGNILSIVGLYYGAAGTGGASGGGFGGGGAGVSLNDVSSGGITGKAGTTYGGGGGGGIASSTTGRAGGAGADGIVIVKSYG